MPGFLYTFDEIGRDAGCLVLQLPQESKDRMQDGDLLFLTVVLGRGAFFGSFPTEFELAIGICFDLLAVCLLYAVILVCDIVLKCKPAVGDFKLLVVALCVANFPLGGNIGMFELIVPCLV